MNKFFTIMFILICLFSVITSVELFSIKDKYNSLSKSYNELKIEYIEYKEHSWQLKYY